MTTLYQRMSDPVSSDTFKTERRKHRRHDLEHRGLTIDRWDGSRKVGKPLGQIVDLSAGGVRIRTHQKDIRPDGQIRVRLELPVFAGIHPFVEHAPDGLKPKREWVGWMSVARVTPVDNQTVEVGGRLVDMDDIDRGMLGLYLSTQPMAA